MFCNSCGKENPDDAQTCAECGADLSEQTTGRGKAAAGRPPAAPPDGANQVPQSVGNLPSVRLGEHSDDEEDGTRSVGDLVSIAPEDTPLPLAANAPPTAHPGASRQNHRDIVDLAARAPSSEAVGEAIGADYDILEPIGQGGMGIVYLARDRKLGRQVAVKRIRATEDAARRGLERFLQEARAIAALNHRNIVTIYALGEDTKGPFIVMEYLPGGNLLTLIEEQGEMEMAKALSIVRSVGQALAYAHRKGIIHRDIKPSNIILTEEGVPKLVDFGLAQMGKESSLSMTGYGMGTLAYMAPEQRRDAKHVDHRSDIYALAKTLYHMLTGEIPDAVDLDMIWPEIRPALKRALKPKPEDRPFSVEEFLRDLEDPSGVSAGVAAAEPAKPGTCIHCGADNPRSVKFCRVCGAGLFEKCPSCGTEDRSGVKHCGSCGVNITRYREALEALEHARQHLEGRRYSRAAKEAAKGLQSGYLRDELRDVQEKALTSQRRLEELRAEAQQLLDAERYEDAEYPLRLALELDPGQKDLATLLAELPARQLEHDIEQTLREARQAMGENRFPVVLDRCARVLEMDGDNAEARDLAAQAEKLAEELQWRLRYARELLLAYQFAQALDALTKIREEFPWWDDEVTKELAKCKESIDHIERLRKEAGKARAGDDLSAELQAWQELLEINPKDAEARSRAAELARAATAARRRVRLVQAAIATVVVLSALAAWAGWNNQQHLSRARMFRDVPDLDRAWTEIGRCGWYWSWGKAALVRELQGLEDTCAQCQQEARELEEKRQYFPAFEKVDEAFTIRPESKSIVDLRARLKARLGHRQDVNHPADDRNDVRCVAFCPDGTRIATAGFDDKVRIWDFRRDRICVGPLEAAEGRKYLCTVAFSPDGEWLAAASYDDGIKLWNARTGEPRKTLRGHERQIRAVAFSPDGQRLASGSEDRSVRIWDMKTAKCVQTCFGHEEPVLSVAFSPDGTQLVSGSADDTFRVWDVASGACCWKKADHSWDVNSVVWSPDGRYIAAGCEKRHTVTLWDAETGECVKQLVGHEQPVYAVAFSPDGRRLASGGFDNTVRIWNVGRSPGPDETDRSIEVLEGYAAAVRSLAFSPDGLCIASGDAAGNLIVWRHGYPDGLLLDDRPTDAE